MTKITTILILVAWVDSTVFTAIGTLCSTVRIGVLPTGVAIIAGTTHGMIHGTDLITLVGIADGTIRGTMVMDGDIHIGDGAVLGIHLGIMPITDQLAH